MTYNEFFVYMSTLYLIFSMNYDFKRDSRYFESVKESIQCYDFCDNKSLFFLALSVEPPEN